MLCTFSNHWNTPATFDKRPVAQPIQIMCNDNAVLLFLLRHSGAKLFHKIYRVAPAFIHYCIVFIVYFYYANHVKTFSDQTVYKYPQ